jgi:hypothetical protein
METQRTKGDRGQGAGVKCIALWNPESHNIHLPRLTHSHIIGTAAYRFKNINISG